MSLTVWYDTSYSDQVPKSELEVAHGTVCDCMYVTALLVVVSRDRESSEKAQLFTYNKTWGESGVLERGRGVGGINLM